MHQSKSSAIAKQQRRQMAEIMAEGKLESARIRVESIIRSDITTELHEILELYCELLLARIQLLEAPYVPPAYLTAKPEPPAPAPAPAQSSSSVAARLSAVLSGSPSPSKQPELVATPKAEPEVKAEVKDGEVEKPKEQLINLPDAGLAEAILAVLYTAPRLGPDIKELSTARLLLLEKLGKDTALRINNATEADAAAMGIPDRVLKRLSHTPPSVKLVDGYLREIARTYGVRFPGDPEAIDSDDDEGTGGIQESIEVPDFEDDEDDAPGGSSGGGGGGSGGFKERPIALANQELSRATPPRDMGTIAPLRIAPPSPSTENVHPKIKLPQGSKSLEAKNSDTSGSLAPAGSKAKPAPLPSSSSTTKDKSDGPGGKVPDFAELEKRFAALKRL
jgi:vacuolar protein sorting-associated protein IST1